MYNLLNHSGERSIVSIITFQDRKVCFVQVSVDLQAMLIRIHLLGIKWGDSRSACLLNIVKDADILKKGHENYVWPSTAWWEGSAEKLINDHVHIIMCKTPNMYICYNGKDVSARNLVRYVVCYDILLLKKKIQFKKLPCTQFFQISCEKPSPHHSMCFSPFWPCVLSITVWTGRVGELQC